MFLFQAPTGGICGRKKNLARLFIYSPGTPMLVVINFTAVTNQDSPKTSFFVNKQR